MTDLSQNCGFLVPLEEINLVSTAELIIANCLVDVHQIPSVGFQR